MTDLLEQFRQRNITVLFSGVQPSVKRAMEQAGFAQKLGEENFMWDAIEAIETLENLPVIDTPVLV